MIINGIEVSAEEFLKGLENASAEQLRDALVQSVDAAISASEPLFLRDDEREAMQPTMRLRWLKVPMLASPATGYVTQVERHILQQEWRGFTSGEWRDVPTVEEST